MEYCGSRHRIQAEGGLESPDRSRLCHPGEPNDGSPGRAASGFIGCNMSRDISREKTNTARPEAAKHPARPQGVVHEMPRRVDRSGALEEPKAPYPKQKQPKPGIEEKMQPRPRYQAPAYKAAGKLENKVALITGGDSGIGRAVAVLYAREGAHVAIVYLPEEQRDAQETRAAVEAEGRRCLLIPGNVADSRFCNQAVQQTVHAFGRLDILVNNAAYQQHTEDVEQISEKMWDQTFRTNIYGYFYMVRAALPHLREGCAIVNTGSITGLRGSKQLLAYSSTKGAIHAFTKSLAQLLVKRKIRVNCVAPGPVWTPLNVSDKEAEQVAEHGKQTPMERAAQPEEVAPSYVFFASEADSSYITGEVLTLLGGQTTAA
jgi:NAD(P)-dependent dehydrogenase (short-subunit alcohol dehydrogenase family)